MAFVRLYREKLAHNFNFLDKLFKENHIEWAVVTKMLCGSEKYIQEIIKIGAKEICDSRISNLKVVKDIDESIETVYIKPPAKRSIQKVIRYADASFNTEFDTIRMLSKEAKAQDKTHKVIIMIEMGDLREGVMGKNLIDFYERVFELPNIEVTGIGTNLNCLHGVMPSQDKLIQLSLYEQLIEAKFSKKIPWVTGGTSVMIPLLFKKQVPPAINHFRVGETLFFGADLFNESTIEGMHNDVIKLFAEIIEINEKPKVPIGRMEANPSGEEFAVKEEDYGKTSFRAIIDIGLLDIQPDFMIPESDAVQIVGASSDMLILELDSKEHNFHVGDLITFRLKYMGALSIFNSDYITQEVV